MKPSPDKRSTGGARAGRSGAGAGRGGAGGRSGAGAGAGAGVGAGAGSRVSQNGTGSPRAPKPTSAPQGGVVLAENCSGMATTSYENDGVKVGSFAKCEQTGPHHGSRAWREIYSTGRNVVETRNAMLKGHGGSSVGLGASTTRLMRGWAEQFFLLTVGAVSVNLRLIQSWMRGEGDPASGDGGDDPKHGRKKKMRRKRQTVGDLASGNDLPAKVA